MGTQNELPVISVMGAKKWELWLLGCGVSSKWFCNWKGNGLRPSHSLRPADTWGSWDICWQQLKKYIFLEFGLLLHQLVFVFRFQVIWYIACKLTSFPSPPRFCYIELSSHEIAWIMSFKSNLTAAPHLHTPCPNNDTWWAVWKLHFSCLPPHFTTAMCWFIGWGPLLVSLGGGGNFGTGADSYARAFINGMFEEKPTVLAYIHL